MKAALTLLSIFSLVLLASCGEKRTETAVANSSADTSVNVLMDMPNTVFYKTHKIGLVPLDSNEYYKAPFVVYNSNDIADTMNVYKHDSTLVLKFDNGDSAILISSPNNNSETYISYGYSGYIRELNSYVVANTYYESSDYSIWNKTTGHETNVASMPQLNPSNTRGICYHRDLMSGESYNGFQIFEIRSDSLHMLWRCPPDWGPDECRWKNDHTIYMRAAYIDFKVERIKYVSMELPDFE